LQAEDMAGKPISSKCFSWMVKRQASLVANMTNREYSRVQVMNGKE
jgi:hypothetical protein